MYKLSFLDKKDLTNGIDWFIPCAMNANEISPKANARLNRIKLIARILKIFVAVYTLTILATLVGVTLGLVSFLPDNFQIRVSPHHSYGWSANVSNGMIDAPVIKLALYLFYGFILFKLLTLYETGKLFTLKNVFYIRILGYAVLIEWVIDYIANNFFNSIGNKPFIDFTCFPPLLALTVIFVSWVMDEGRKIQEEQELTV